MGPPNNRESKMKRFVVLALSAVAFISVAGTFDTEDYFSMTLPDDWIRIPPEVLDVYPGTAMEGEVAPVETYDYGFQLESAGEWFSYPCILVQVRNNVGRYTTGELAQFMEQQGDVVDARLERDNTFYSGIVEKDGVAVMIGRQLTEYGFIQLNGFCAAESLPEYEEAFRSAFASLKIDEAIRYKPQLTDNAPVWRGINLGILGLALVLSALVGGVLWFIYAMILRMIRRK